MLLYEYLYILILYILLITENESQNWRSDEGGSMGEETARKARVPITRTNDQKETSQVV